jgi:alpha-1,2-mannosyltransferase
MSGFVDGLRSGAWLTRERMRLIALGVLAASGFGLLFVLATSDGLNDYQSRPLGTDFSNVYAAGTYVLEGRAAVPFDPLAQHAREQAIFGEKTPFYGWHYPPFFLFLAAALALMPYALALLVWQATTLALYLAVIRAIVGHGAFFPLSRLRGRVGKEALHDKAPATCPLPASCARHPPPQAGEGKREHLWLLLALAFPAVFVNIGHGHNGFLTAALLGGALLVLDRRPILAGILFGLLAYKPQFGVMLPLVLVVTGRWRAVLAAAATVAALAILATLAFGPDVWSAFAQSMRFTREVVLEDGNTGWYKIQSIFSWVRMWGGPVPLAYAVQGAAMLAVGAALAWLWRSDAAYPLKAAALCLAAILATPYSLDYDMMVLAPAIAFLAVHGLAHGFAPYEKTALALLWITPLIARGVAQIAFVPLGVIAMLAVFALVLHRATVRQHAIAPPPVPTPA